ASGPRPASSTPATRSGDGTATRDTRSGSLLIAQVLQRIEKMVMIRAEQGFVLAAEVTAGTAFAHQCVGLVERILGYARHIQQQRAEVGNVQSLVLAQARHRKTGLQHV